MSARLAFLAVLVASLAGCSLKTMAAKTVADTLSGSGDVFSRDDDPELVRLAVPFALKTYESLLETVPRHEALIVATCSGFVQYGYAFVQNDAEIVQFEDPDEARALKARAVKLYLRAKDYCFRGLEIRFPGVGQAILEDPAGALTKAVKKDVPLLYWTAAAWGLAIGLQPDLAIDLPSVRALVERALRLDPDWNKGALHEVMITLESQGDALGGSEARARQHFARAVELQKGLSPGPYLSLATGITVPKQDRAEFEKLVNAALAIDAEKDKSNRLVTLITQARARALFANIDALFARDANPLPAWRN
jgi:predicted anti-sigma-YlaC factor YlaD